MKKHKKMVKSLVLISASANPRKSSNFLWIFPLFSRIIKYMPQIKKRGNEIDYDGHVGTGDMNMKRLYADISNTGLKSYLYSMA